MGEITDSVTVEGWDESWIKFEKTNELSRFLIGSYKYEWDLPMDSKLNCTLEIPGKL